jgi:hypothetical protein
MEGSRFVSSHFDFVFVFVLSFGYLISFVI